MSSSVTGYHRKHAIRVLRHRGSEPPSARQHVVQYGPDVREALVALWEASDRLCSKRLKPLIPILLPALERHGRLELNTELRDKLLMVSAATMDRLLSEVRVVARGGQRRRAGMSSAVRRSVPVLSAWGSNRLTSFSPAGTVSPARTRCSLRVMTRSISGR